MARSTAQVKNSIHNLSVSYNRLQTEYWVLRAEMGHETATRLERVIHCIDNRIKDLEAELAVREAMEE